MSIISWRTDRFVLFCSVVPDKELLQKIDERFRKTEAAALIMNSAPYLQLGFIDPRDYSCSCPLAEAFAVSLQWYSSIGGEDVKLGDAMAADMLYRVKSGGGKIECAFDLVLPAKKRPEDVTAKYMDGALLDIKHGSLALRVRTLKAVADALLHYDVSIGNYSRSVLVRKLPSFLVSSLKYCLSSRRAAAARESIGFFFNSSIRGSCALPVMEPAKKPLVSVVVRTHKRPETLRLTLEGLRYQGYENLEIVVIEDGEPTSEEMIRQEFSDLPIRYKATGENIGRAAAANLGFSLAKGEYINLLDDDDFLFPGHIHAALCAAEHDGSDMVFLQSLALEITKTGSDPYEFEINKAHFMNFPRIDPFTMSFYCQTPDNGVFFKKSLLDTAVGMREELGANEDWSLWLRMMTVARWSVVPYATSAFVNPASATGKEARTDGYARFRGMQLKDDMLRYKTTGAEVRGYFEGLMDDMSALAATRQMDDVLRKQAEEWNITADENAAAAFDEFVNEAATAEGGCYTAEQFNGWYCGTVAHFMQLPDEHRSSEIDRLRSVVREAKDSKLPTKKIAYVGFWPWFDPNDNFITDKLKQRYHLELSSNPDYVFCSMFGVGFYEYMRYDCPRIFFSGENYSPDFNVVDYGMSYNRMEFEDRYMRVPEFYVDIRRLRTSLKRRPTYEQALEIVKNKPEFCNFIYGDSACCPEREGLFRAINACKTVSSAGTWLNNMDGYTVDMLSTKPAFLRKFRFTIACESVAMPGFVTEKLTDAFEANTIPIYYGDPHVAEIFNDKAFIDVRRFDSLEAVAEEVMRLEQNPEEMARMLSEPIFKDPDYLEKLDKEFAEFLYSILDREPEDAIRRAPNGQPEVHQGYLTFLAKLLPSKTYYRYVKKRAYLNKYAPWLIKQE